MTYSSDSLERFATAVCTDLKTWPQLLPFRQPVPAGRQSRYFTVAVFASVVMHAFLAFLLWVVATDRTAVEPAAPSIGKPLIVSLVSSSALPTASHNGPDRETVSAVPHTGSPAERSQSSPERSRSAGRKAEAEAVATSKGHGVPGPGSPEDKSIATGTTPSINLEAAYQIAQEIGRMPNYEAQSPRFAQVTLNERNHPAETGAPRLNCKTAYAKKGLLVIPLAIINMGCVW